MRSSDVAKGVEVRLHCYTHPAFNALPKIMFTVYSNERPY